MKPHRYCGITVIELLIGVAVMSIVLGLAIPPFQSLAQRSLATASINWLVGSIAFTRHAAMINRTMVTLCPSIDGTKCGGYWHQGSISFTDHNSDRVINGRDHLLNRFLSPVSGGSIKFRAFRNKQYLQMTPEGMTNYQNGNFVYCSADRDPRFSRQLIINVQGRTRLAHDRDGDGVVEDRSGKPLRC